MEFRCATLSRDNCPPGGRRFQLSSPTRRRVWPTAAPRRLHRPRPPGQSRRALRVAQLTHDAARLHPDSGVQCRLVAGPDPRFRLAPTHPHCEIIVVDDGSTDSTLAVARSYESREVRVLSQANSGASAARNRALQLARGDFIQYLDADDLLSPEKIAAQLTVLHARAPGILATCRWGRFEDDPARARFVDAVVFRHFPPVDYLLPHTREARMMHPGAWLVPRNVADRAGPWDERLSLNDDGEYFARVVLASAGIVFTPDPAAAYYRSGIGGSLSQRRSPRALASLALSVELVAAHLAAAEDSDRTRQALADYR